ncbi:MAG: tetratricopeptide repeat protein [Calditrichaceae bacterium]|nr:tetratricopeptide repeat protein [Calditrichaceae bacterium]MBN2710247.1 tetratricopeptide repeat protein [Calditrichaceae bacterium]
MEKIIKNFIKIVLALTIVSCAAGKKEAPPEVKISDDEAKIKAHDHFLKGLFFQSDEQYDKALIEFYEALRFDSSAAEIYNSIAENHLKMGHYKSAHVLLEKALKLDPKNKEALTLTADSYFRLRKDQQAVDAYRRLLDVDPYNEEARKILMFLYKKTNNEVGAAEQYEHLLRIYGHDSILLNELIRIYTRNREYEKAIRLYNRLLEEDSLRSEIYYQMGDLYEKMNRTDSAIVYFKKSISEKNDFLPSYERIALNYRLHQKWQEIIDLFTPLLQYEHTSTTARIMIAESLYYLEKFDAAREMLEPALDQADVSWSIFDLVGRIDLELKNYESAEQHFKRLIEKDPTNRTAWLFLGFTYSDRHNFKQAEETYWQALKHLPTDPVLLTFYGQTLYNLDRKEEARTYLERAVEYNPKYRYAIEKLSLIYRESGNWEGIISLFQPLIAQDSTDVSSNLMIAEAEFYLKRYSAVEEKLAPLLNMEKVPWGVYDLLGRIEMEKKDYDRARVYFNKILESDRKNRIAWLFIGFTYSDNAEFEMAAETFMQGLVELPEDASLWAFYGITMQSMGKPEDAIYPLEQALKYDPEHLNALTTLPVIYETLKQFAKSDSLYESALRIYPDNDLLLNNYSYSLSERGLQLERALQMVQKALGVKPDNAAYLDTIGWIYYKLGHYAAAEPYIKKSLEIQEDSAVVSDHLGDVYYKLNDTSSAKKYWQKALELDPDNENVKKKLKEIQ